MSVRFRPTGGRCGLRSLRLTAPAPAGSNSPLGSTILAPSDARTLNGALRVGGRVVLCQGRLATLADAFDSIALHFLEPPLLRPGDLIVACGQARHGVVRDARLIAHQPAIEPVGDSEVARLSWRGVGRHLRARAEALAGIREHFSLESFTEVDTPLRARCPQLDAGVQSVPAGSGWLIASPEYHMKRLLTGGMPRIFQLVHCSREEELGRWHEPEFMMLEWYRSFASLDDILVDTEIIVSDTVRRLSGRLEVEVFGGNSKVEVRAPFEQITVKEAFRRFAGVHDVVDIASTDEERYFRILVDSVEPALARFRRPVFLRGYPLSQAALARPTADDPELADRLELYLGGIELCNGYAELTDPVENANRLRHQSELRRETRGERAPVDERFLSALAEGMPQAAGNALGVDRLIAIALGTEGIADVQAFPASVV